MVTETSHSLFIMYLKYMYLSGPSHLIHRTWIHSQSLPISSQNHGFVFKEQPRHSGGYSRNRYATYYFEEIVNVEILEHGGGWEAFSLLTQVLMTCTVPR
ncbi:hypothetical protein AYI68_g3371 [Smittium mucronatum]|uniref:Uncharacterized protein n=1 Tax=Smittium mucronatum TaxID=133383 RepID=A0A1R0H075_9FUNG|nr:hypothetical protein AYI68_g3371 [Smittium mucronatum]